jgi:hypothetical protein
VPFEIPRLDGGAAVAPERGIHFARVPYRVGERWSTSVRAESKMADTGSGEQVSAYVSEFVVEVLAVEGPAPTRMRVTFERNAQEYQGGATATAIDGKSYVVDARGPSVSSESGAAASSDEERRVLDVFPDLGTRTRLDEVLPDDPMQIGDRRDELAGAILRILHPRAWTEDKGSASLARVDGDLAAFAVTIAASSQTGMKMDVRGEAKVRLRDSRLASLLLTGSYSGGATGTSGDFSVRRIVRDR